jgi:hypothetical protein
MVASWLAALWLGLIAPASVPEARDNGGEVIVDVLEVLVEPDDSGYSSGELRRGDRVSIVSRSKPGWLAIAPPEGSFDWIDASSIQVGEDRRGQVVAEQAPVRIGADGARMPGPPLPTLAKGASVRLLDRPPLTLGTSAKARSWRAIAPLNGELRYIRLNGVRVDPVATSKSDDPRVQPTQVDQRGSEVDSSDAVSKFEEALRRSRAIDNEVEKARQTLNIARTSTERGYDARGMLQASSRKVEGQKVHALIGPEGTPIAYLAIPPGVPASRFLTRKVGVRGDVHFNESLGARLITVKDLDPLDKPR